MARIIDGSDHLLTSQSHIEHYLQEKIAKNDHKGLGTEVEFFFLDPRKNPITVASGQFAFQQFQRIFDSSGYDITLSTEFHDNADYITGLSVKGLGSLELETNHGFEFASKICKNPHEVHHVNRVFFDALAQVEKSIGYSAVFTGYAPEYAEPVPIMRERTLTIRESLIKRHGNEARKFFSVNGSTASTQVNVDTCQNDVHEVFKVLLLAEAAFGLHYGDGTNRAYRREQVYGSLVPARAPLIDMWDAKNSSSAITCVVERAMTLGVPYLPGANGGYQKLPLDPMSQKAPTVACLMEHGLLTEKNFNNILPLFQTLPAWRRPAVLELRGVDSQGSPEKIAELAGSVAQICYDRDTRKEVLETFGDLTRSDIGELHQTAAWENKFAALNHAVGGTKVKKIVEDMVCLSRPKTEGINNLLRACATNRAPG